MKEGLHRPSVGEEGLQDEESDGGKKNRLAPEDSAPIPRRCHDITAVEEVEHLADHEGIDSHGAGVLDSETGVDPLIEKRGADRGGEKDVDRDVVELEEKTFEQAVTGRRGKLVGSVPGKQRGGLGRGEPIPGLRAEFGQDVLQFCSVPGHRFDFIVDHPAWGGNANRW